MIPLGVLASARVAGGGGDPLTVEYVGSASLTTGPWTFTDFNVGADYAGREIIVGVVGAQTGNRTVTRVTMNGVPATLETNGQSGYAASQIARGTPSGSTVTITVTTDSAIARCAIFVFKTSAPVIRKSHGRGNVSGTSVACSASMANDADGWMVTTGGSLGTGAITWTVPDIAGGEEQLLLASASTHAAGLYQTATETITPALGTDASTQKQIRAASYVPEPGGALDLTYMGSQADTSTQTVYTFAGLDFGAADTDRVITVAMASRGTNSLLSVTIGGVAATQDLHTWKTGASDVRVSIHRAVVPTGTSGDVVVTFGGNMNHCALGWWRTVGGPVVLNSWNSTSVNNELIPTDASTGGYAIGINHAQTAGVTWAGLTEQFDLDLAGFRISAASSEFTDNVNPSVFSTIGTYGTTAVAAYRPA